MAANNRVNLTLGVNADVSQAKRELQSLQNSISNLVTLQNQGDPLQKFNQSTVEAIQKVSKLSAELAAVTNSNGTLNIGKLANMWKGNSQALEQYRLALHSLGAEGDRAFRQLATTIANAQQPVRELDGLIGKFAKGLANTAMWTLQSNAIHAVQSALRGAFSYAQQLNKGLTDISIVSDLNTQQLTEFAKTANRMAKDLNASTSDVVSGALIYYQAGLSDEEVIKRTETTIKLAQTSGESAEQISSYMTAIWNNFYDGSKSVEYYADAISYLGAVTAASNADIAEGMQAFSAVAETVGLSFEYGASALTLLRDVTQQSASTIGNSLKTIFARLSSVSQGETLEDGVDYTKYTKALENVGVSVLDINGDLRTMDEILDDLAEHWGDLGNAQQVALAQTVGGVRQYNNLISLMNNYGRFQELAAGASQSTGYLQSQADEYAESWEAARNRVQAAWQGFFDELIDDDRIIKLTKGFAQFIDYITGFAKTLLPTIISLLGIGLNKNLADINTAIVKIVHNTIHWKDTLKEAENLRQTAALSLLSPDASNISSNADDQAIANEIQDKYQNYLNEIERAKTSGVDDSIINQNLQLAERYYTLLTDIQKKIVEIDNLRASSSTASGTSLPATGAYSWDSLLVQANNSGIAENIIQSLSVYNNTGAFKGEKGTNFFHQLITQYAENLALSLDQGEIASSIGTKLASMQKYNGDITDDVVNGYIEQWRGYLLNPADIIRRLFTAAGVTDEDLANVNAEVREHAEEVRNQIQKPVNELVSAGRLFGQVKIGSENVNTALDETNKTLTEERKKVDAVNAAWYTNIGYISSAISSLTGLIRSLDTINQGLEDLSKHDIKSGIKNISTGLLSGASTMLMFANAIQRSKMLEPIVTSLGTNIANAFGKAVKAEQAFSVGLSTVMVAAVAAIVLIKAVASAIDANNPESQVRRLTEATKELQQAATEAADGFKQVNDTLDGLGDKYNNIDKLVSGTQAWRMAVNELNQELLSLITKYNLVYGEDYTYENGVIRFTPSGEDKLKNNAEQEATQTQRAAQNAEIATVYGQFQNQQNKYDNALTHVLNRLDKFDTEFATQLREVEDNPQLASELISNYLATNPDMEIESIWDRQLGELPANRTRRVLTRNLQNIANNDYQDEENNLYNQARNSIQTKFNEENFSDEALDYLTEQYLERLQSAPEATNAQLTQYINSIGGQVTRTQSGQMQATLANGTVLSRDTLLRMWQTEWANDSLDLATAKDLTQDIFGTKRGTDHDVGSDGYTKNETAEMERYSEVVKKLNNNWEKLGYTQQEVSKTADDLATDYINFNKGLADVIKNYDNYITNLKEADTSSMDYINTLAELRNDLELMFDIDPSNLTDEFFTENNVKIAEDLEKAAKGDFDALYDLQELLARDILHLDTTGFSEKLKSAAQTAIDEINNSEQWDDIQIGASFDSTELTTGFGNAMDALLSAGEITATQLQDTLDAIGWEPQIDWVEMTAKDAKDLHQRGYLRAGDSEPIPVDDWLHVEDDTHVWVPRLNRSKTTFKGAPKARVNQSNQSNAAKNAKGSGGGSSKNKDKEVDRYHEITSQLEQTSHALDMVNSAENAAYGPDKLALMDEKIKLLERETEQYKQLYDEAKAYYDADRERLATGYGAQFNADGSIANYDAWYKQFVDKYNSGQMDDDAWKAFEDAIKKYEDSLKHLNDAEKNVQDNLIEIFNQKLEKIEYKLKYLNKTIDQDIEYLDYMIEQLDKDMYKTADVLALMGSKMGDIFDKVDNERNAIAGILGLHDNFTEEDIQKFLDGQMSVEEALSKVGELTADEIEDLQQHQSALLEYNKILIQIREESYAKISESISEFNDQIERQIDIIKDVDSVMNHYKNIIDIVGKDALGISDEMLEDLDRVSVLAAKSQLEISKDQLDTNKATLEDLYNQRAAMEADASEEDKRLMDEEIKKQEDEVRRLTEAWASSWEGALKIAEEAFKNSIQRATDAFGAAMAGSLGSLENLQEAFDQQKQLEEKYLPAYERIYQLNKLTRDVNKAIDNTNNIAGKERLLKLQNEIVDKQQSGAEITEYEVGMLQRRLELEQARIALEEGQNAKNLVRMTRDNEGNWSYVYTADESRTAELEQDYEDKLYNLKKFNQESLAAFEEAMWKAIEDYKNSIADLNLTDEERAQRIKEFTEDWVEHNGNMMQMALDDAQWIVDEYGQGVDDLKNQWHETVTGQITDYDSLQQVMDTFKQSSAEMIGTDNTTGIRGAYAQWGLDVHDIFDTAGSDADAFATDVQTAMEQATTAMIGDGTEDEGAVGKAKQFSNDLKTVFDDILTNIQTWLTGEDGYFNKIDSITTKNTDWYNSIQDLITQYNNLKTAAEEAAAVEGPQGNGTGNVPASGGSGGGSGGGGGGGGNPEPPAPPAKTPVWTYTNIRHKTNPTNVYFYKHGSEPSITKQTGWQWKKLDQDEQPMSDWYDVGGTGGGGGGGVPMVKADTGMYTGEWGPEGKIAMLHEKELVLNKHDTANMLKTVEFVRDITQMLSLNASAMSTGLGSLTSNAIGTGGNYLDQNVTIHAEFPNATNHSEIEEAFNNLIGLASQYAGRKQ